MYVPTVCWQHWDVISSLKPAAQHTVIQMFATELLLWPEKSPMKMNRQHQNPWKFHLDFCFLKWPALPLNSIDKFCKENYIGSNYFAIAVHIILIWNYIGNKSRVHVWQAIRKYGGGGGRSNVAGIVCPHLNKVNWPAKIWGRGNCPPAPVPLLRHLCSCSKRMCWTKEKSSHDFDFMYIR